jgi:hypothetical protein
MAIAIGIQDHTLIIAVAGCARLPDYRITVGLQAPRELIDHRLRSDGEGQMGDPDCFTGLFSTVGLDVVAVYDDKTVPHFEFRMRKANERMPDQRHTSG